MCFEQNECWDSWKDNSVPVHYLFVQMNKKELFHITCSGGEAASEVCFFLDAIPPLK